MDTDEILISNILNGDTDSFSNLVLRYKDRIFAFLLKMTFSKDDAEELLQEVFINVYKNLYRYNSNWKFSTWIYKIAANSFKNYYKKKKRLSQLETIHDFNDISNMLQSVEDCPEVVFERKEDYLSVVRIINSLKADQRIALVLKYIKGFSFKEIGEILNISPEAAKMKVQRAKESICKQYGKHRKGGFSYEMQL
ncbi:MAG: sigma-70 family RNA polymerase sigma factor [Clostridiaceae bacterium]|nr:sigma-70 family RNA polymerase sigma factor [Clostridiaceae bacterium]